MIEKVAALVLFFLCFVCFDDAHAEERFAKKYEGTKLNQGFAQLEDGTFYAVHDKKVVPANIPRTPEEIAAIHNRALIWLNQFSHWTGGRLQKKMPSNGIWKERKDGKDIRFFGNPYPKKTGFMTALRNMDYPQKVGEATNKPWVSGEDEGVATYTDAKNLLTASR